MKTFDEVLPLLKNGQRARRLGWNGLEQWVACCDSWNGNVAPGMALFYLQPFLYLRNTKADITPWAPSQGDLFAEDWEILS